MKPSALLHTPRDLGFFWFLYQARRAFARGAAVDGFARLMRLAPLAGSDVFPYFHARKLGRLLGNVAGPDARGIAPTLSAMLLEVACREPAMFISRYSAFQPWVDAASWPAAVRRDLYAAAMSHPEQPTSPFGAVFAETGEERIALLNRYLAQQGVAPGVRAGPEAVPVVFDPGSGGGVEEPLVSVVMTAYKAQATLPSAIDSVLAQTWRNLELVIADDASPDQGWDVIRAASARDPRVRGIRLARNGGTYRAKNLALRSVRGALVTFHDSDDVSHPTKIALQVEALLRRGRAASLSHWIRMGADGICIPARTGRYVRRNFSSLMFRRELLDRLGFFDSVRVSADSEYIDRIRAAFGRRSIVEVVQPLSFGFVSATSLTRLPETVQSEFFTSPLREQYALAFRQWHARAQHLHVPYPIGERPFPAPAAIVSAAADDTIAETV
jgi:hypothetical protein